MNTLVIYESQFGNTERIAQAITQVFAQHGVARLEPIEKAGPSTIEGLDLLVLGSPTQYHEATPDMMAWMDQLPPGTLDGLAMAVFDTRYHMPTLLTGSAAKMVARAVVDCGGRLIVSPESFFVTERYGPLEAGEVERAAAWAGKLVATLAIGVANSRYSAEQRN